MNQQQQRPGQQINFYDTDSDDGESDVVSSTPPGSPKRQGRPRVIPESPFPLNSEQTSIFKSFDDAEAYVKRRRLQYTGAVSVTSRARHNLERALLDLEVAERRERKLSTEIKLLMKTLPGFILADPGVSRQKKI